MHYSLNGENKTALYW